MTNGDKIRELPDEVLAEILYSVGEWLDWLESEAEE